MVLDQDKETDRHWTIVTLLSWGLISGWLFARAWRLWGSMEVSLTIVSALIAGFILALIVVGLPYRVLQNVTRPERRKTRIRETVLCVLTSLALVNLVYSFIMSYPSDW